GRKMTLGRRSWTHWRSKRRSTHRPRIPAKSLLIRRIPSATRPLTQPLVTDRTYPPLSDHNVSANARDRRSSLRYSLQRYLIYFLGGIRWWILFRLNCSNYKLVLRPGAPTANTSGNRFLMNSGTRHRKCSSVIHPHSSTGS